MMKRIAFLMVVIAFLVLVSGAVAQTEDSEILPHGQVAQGTISGGEYRLSRSVWQVGESVRGGAYQLTTQSTQSLQSGGCCCTYMPCVIKKMP
jgi:hypothetical protein